MSFREVFDALLQCLVVVTGFLDIIPVLRSSFLQILDLLMEVDERAKLWDLRYFTPNLFCLFFLFEVGLFSVRFTGHRSITDYIKQRETEEGREDDVRKLVNHSQAVESFQFFLEGQLGGLFGFLWAAVGFSFGFDGAGIRDGDK